MTEHRDPGHKLILILLCLLILLEGCTPPLLAARPAATSLPASSAAATLSLTPTMAPTITFTPAPTSTPTGGSGMLFFQDLSRNNPNQEILGVQAYNLSTGAVTTLADNTYRLVGASPDRQSLLLFQGNSLYAKPLSGGAPVLLSQHIEGGWVEAVWCPSNVIVFLETHTNVNDLYRVNPDGTGMKLVSTADWNPVELFPACDGSRVFFAAGTVDVKSNSRSIWWADIDTGAGGQFTHLPSVDPQFSPDGRRMAFNEFSKKWRWTTLSLVEIDPSNPDGKMSPREPDLGDIPYDMIFFDAWSPDGQRLAASVTSCDPMCGNYRYYIFSSSGALLSEIKLPEVLEGGYRFVWSPDGKMLYIQADAKPAQKSPRRRFLYKIAANELTSINEDFPLEASSPIIW